MGTNKQDYDGPSKGVEEDDDFVYYGGGSRQVKPHREPDPGDEDYPSPLDEPDEDMDEEWDDDWHEEDDEDSDVYLDGDEDE